LFLGRKLKTRQNEPWNWAGTRSRTSITFSNFRGCTQVGSWGPPEKRREI
jgi:hypothetical protein